MILRIPRPASRPYIGAMTDTSPEAARIQTRVQRGLGGPGRLRLAFELTSLARGLAAAGMRARHPTWTTMQIWRAIYRLPAEPARRVTGGQAPPRA